MAYKALQGLVGFLAVALMGCGSQQPEGASSSLSTVKQSLGSWAYTTGNLSSVGGRNLHTETVLPSGKVLVVGGQNGSTYLNTTALYDPSTQTWTSAGTLNEARAEHTATLLSNGNVVITGGYNSTSGTLASVEIYDPSSGPTGTWSSNPAWDMAYARGGHKAVEVTTLSGDQLLVMGGYDSSFSEQNSAELFDPGTNSWGSAAWMNSARTSFGAVKLSSGNVLVSGGWSFFSIIDGAEEYDPSTDTWTSVGNMLVPRAGHTATLLASGNVLVTGGLSQNGGGFLGLDSAELYTPGSPGSWSTAGNMPYNTFYTNNGRTNHAAVLLASGEVLVAGGNGNAVNKSAVLYDPSTNSWSATADMNDHRQDFTLSLLSSTGDVLSVGGSYHPTTSELYTP